jgi:pimeloyl-ACP methyl ester carboxylesterase
MFVRTQGKYKPGQEFVVLIHGTSASHNYWRSSAEEISDKRFVVMVDLRGHGQSIKTPAFSPSNSSNTFRYTYELFALDTLATLTAMGLTENFYCGGISIGSSICMDLENRVPSRFLGKILVSGAPLFRCADLTIDGTVSGCAPDQPGDIAPWLTNIPTNVTTLLPEDVLSAYPSTCDVTAARDKIAQNRAVSMAAVASLVRYAQTTDQTSILPNLKSPTLLVHGLSDITNGIEAVNFLHAHLANSVILEYEGRGHLMPITDGYRLGQQILSFILGEDEGVRATRARVFDKGCQVSPLVAPEDSFEVCA